MLGISSADSENILIPGIMVIVSSFILLEVNNEGKRADSGIKKCNPDDIVMYNFENAYTNDEYERMYPGDLPLRYGGKTDILSEFDMGIDDVKIGYGTLRGFVFLTEDLLEE